MMRSDIHLQPCKNVNHGIVRLHNCDGYYPLFNLSSLYFFSFFVMQEPMLKPYLREHQPHTYIYDHNFQLYYTKFDHPHYAIYFLYWYESFVVVQVAQSMVCFTSSYWCTNQLSVQYVSSCTESY